MARHGMTWHDMADIRIDLRDLSRVSSVAVWMTP
jgi:hypothetical protein